MEDRIINPEEMIEDQQENSIRPITISDYIGQSEVKENLDVFKIKS